VKTLTVYSVYSLLPIFIKPITPQSDPIAVKPCTNNAPLWQSISKGGISQLFYKHRDFVLNQPTLGHLWYI